jgi:DNA processing protein
VTTETSVATVLALEPAFPRALAGVTPAVKALWYRGRLPQTGEGEQPALAIVGGRSASLRGCRRAADFAAGAVGRGYAIVSGGALGIDAAAHRGALDAGGTTYAVLGCGVDVVYPDRHATLFEDIAATGGLISEYGPGTPPKRGHFPVRNRLVAALAEAVVVVEARQRSGALITARLARDLGRALYAVPGSLGTDQLLAAGAATCITDAGDLIRALAGERIARRPPSRLAPLLELLAGGPAQPGDICRRLGIPLPAALALVAEAEIESWVRRFPGGGIALLSLEPERDHRAS